MDKNQGKKVFWYIVATLGVGIGVFVFFQFEPKLFNEEVQAVTGGQMVLYFHREDADVNTTYNAMALTPPEVDAATGNSDSTAGFLAPCEAAGVTNTITQVNVEMDSGSITTGEKCVATFISLPVGQPITFNTTDTNSLSVTLYAGRTPSTGDPNNGAVTPKAYIYRYSGGVFTIIGTLTGTPLGVSIASQTIPGTPSSDVFLTATDRIAIILVGNLTVLDTSTGQDRFEFHFDQTSRPASAKLLYTVITPNKPELSGAKDADFTNPVATTSCTNGGVSITVDAGKTWTCATPSGATLGTVSVDASGGNNSSQWLILKDSEDGTLGTNFGASPENTYIYETVDTKADGDGNITTVVNSSINTTAGASPFFHSGLLLWASNTDYLILEATYNGSNRGVAINNNGTISNSTAISGNYNRIWLRWSKTGTAYQAKYSVDGSVWTDLGGAIARSGTFGRAGLNAYSAEANTNYGGAFEFFDYAFHNVSGWAWSENIGWISTSSVDCDADGNGFSEGTPPGCPSAGTPIPDYGLVLNSTSGGFSGYAWSEHIGWIKFDPAGPYPEAPAWSACLDLPGAGQACDGQGNYTVSGWAQALAVGGGWDGWLKMRGTTGVAYGVVINSLTKELQGWAWGGDVVGWVSFNCLNESPPCGIPYKVLAAISLATPPNAISLTAAALSYCPASSPPVVLSWTFDDPGDSQSAYQVQIKAGVADFTSPTFDTGKVLSASGQYAPPALAYGTTYFWRVKVWDSTDLESAWVGAPSSFATAAHAYPKPSNFSWTPLNPAVGQLVQFDDGNPFDPLSNPAQQEWGWDMDKADGVCAPPPFSSCNYSVANPTHTYAGLGPYIVTLFAKDELGTCSAEKTVSPSKPFPKWKEISPF